MKTGIEWQVSSLAPSQRLKELGVKQESCFYWMEKGASQILTYSTDDGLCSPSGLMHYEWLSSISAFTVAELGEMLPKNIFWNSITGFTEGAWSCEVMIGHEHHREGADTEADAHAKCLIYLLENSLITL